jgi:hypothetical protein
MKAVSSYLLPALLTMAGGALLIVGLLQGQNGWTLFGAGLALIAGLLSFALQLGLIDRRLGLIIGVVMILIAGALAWRNHRAAKSTPKTSAALHHPHSTLRA